VEKQFYTNISRQLNFAPQGIKIISHLSFDLVLFLAIAFSLHTPLYWGAQLLIPVFFFRSFALMHDCVHSSASSKKWLNDWIGVLAGACCFLPYEPWKRIHLDHHKWTGNVDRDPSMGLLKRFPHFSQRKIQFLNFCWKNWIPAMATSQHLVFWTKSYQYVVNSKTRASIAKNIISLALPLGLYCLIPWREILPGLILYLLMVEVINFPHHLQMPMVEGDISFPVYQQDQLARSCIYPRWFSRHVLNNFNLHIEHHLFPRLPWYQLEEARFMIRQLGAKNYGEVLGNQWIRQNRRKPVELVFAKTLQPLHQTSAQREVA
jgi:omega-6 fatty acid desaturase (delta-12 desaturase)